MWMKETQFSVRLGGNTYINTPKLISFLGEPLFILHRDEGGYLAIDFEIYNDKQQKIASVKKNNIYPHKDYKTSYVLDGTADSLSLIDKDSGKTVVEIKRRTASTQELDISITTYLPNGEPLILAPDSSNIRGNTFIGCTFKNSEVAIALD